MEVLLIAAVEKLGEPGDLVKVSEGYARNFLIPRGLAVEPTPHNVERFKRIKERRAAELKEKEEWAKSLKTQLDGLVLNFYRKAHEGKLYSSVRREDIAEKIKEQINAEIEKGKIELETPIEALGIHAVKVSLYKDISASIRVVVEEER